MKAIGIDLGTTNSAAAASDGKEVKILPTQDGESLTPSVVSFVKRRKKQAGEIVVGRQAVNNAERDPANTIFSIKRLMGRVYGEKQIVDQVHDRFGLRIAEAPPAEQEDQGVKIILDDRSYTPVEISAMILKKIKSDAELALGEAVTHAVITVPAWFEERQRQATAAAGSQAGLQVIEVIDEPTMAAVAFGLGKEEERHRVLVFDLGGGTFDISIIQMTAGQYSVLEIRGDNWLGGDDFDQTIVTRLVRYLKEEHDYDPSGDQAVLSKLKVAAQRAKTALSAQQSAEILETYFREGGAEPIDIDMEVTREEFEADIQPLVDKTIALVEEALEAQNLTPADITQVLMVGGSTAVPSVLAAVRKMFEEQKVRRHINPMECVALGAGIRAAGAKLEAGAETGDDEGPRLDQVTAMDLGIGAVKGDNPDVFVPIIPKGTPYPLTEAKRRIFSPTEENQTLIRVPVYEGLSQRASLNEQQGVIEFPLPEGIALSAKVEVAFNYDRNRVLTVKVRVVGTDHFIEETLRRDRARMQTAGESLVDDWREELQPAFQTGQQFLDIYGSDMTQEDRAEVEEAIRQAEQALANDDQTGGTQATLLLQNKIMGSGTASLLFITERAMHGASPEATQLLAQAVGTLRAALERGDQAEVDRLSTELRLAVAQLMSQRAGIQGVEDRKDLESLLRVTE